MRNEGVQSMNPRNTIARRSFLNHSLALGLTCAIARNTLGVMPQDSVATAVLGVAPVAGDAAVIGQAPAPTTLSVPPVMRLAPLTEGRPSPVITALAIDPSGKYAAAAGDDHGLRWFALHGSNQPYVNASVLDAHSDGIHRDGAHSDWVQAIEISATGKWLASCAKDGTLQVWRRDARSDAGYSNAGHSNAGNSDNSGSGTDASSPTWERVHSQRVEHALFTIKFIGEHSLIAAGFSNSIYRLDLDLMKWSLDHTSECSDIRALAISSDQRTLAYGGRDGAVRLIDLDRVPAVMDQKRECVMEVQAHTNRIRAMVFSADDSLIYSVAEDRRLVGIDRKSESIQYQLDVGAGRLMAIERLSEERYAVSGSDNTIRLLQPSKSLGGGRTFQVSNVNPEGTVEAKEIALPKTGKLAGRCKLIGHDGTIAVLRSHGDYLYSGSFDTTIRSWNISDALIHLDDEGRFIHPVSAQFENSGAQERIR